MKLLLGLLMSVSMIACGGGIAAIAVNDSAVDTNQIENSQTSSEYYTYTLSTLNAYPFKAGSPKVDKYNNVQFTGTADAIGFNQYYQNFSLEMKVNFQAFTWPSQFYISARASYFDRAMSPNLQRKGYTYRFGATGSIEIYKEGASLASVNIPGFVENRDYIFEIGAVDINENATRLFINIDNQEILSIKDENLPIQKCGFINMNGDSAGAFGLTLQSSYSKLTPLQTSATRDEKGLTLSTSLLGPFAYGNMNYDMFTKRLLQAIYINESSVFELNEKYYSLDGGTEKRFVDVNYTDGKLIVSVANNAYAFETNSQQSFVVERLALKKTTSEGGMLTPSGKVLKEDYIFKIV